MDSTFEQILGINPWHQERIKKLKERLALIQDQIDLYDASRNDNEAGFMPEGVLVCISNILEYGHPAGADNG